MRRRGPAGDALPVNTSCHTVSSRGCNLRACRCVNSCVPYRIEMNQVPTMNEAALINKNNPADCVLSCPVLLLVALSRETKTRLEHHKSSIMHRVRVLRRNQSLAT